MIKKNKGVVGRIYEQSVPSFVGGADAELAVQLSYRGTSDLYQIAGFTGATGQFPGVDGYASPVNVVGSLESADLGLLRFPISAANSALIARGDELSFQVRFVDGNGTNIIILDGQLSVRDALFGAQP